MEEFGTGGGHSLPSYRTTTAQINRGLAGRLADRVTRLHADRIGEARAAPRPTSATIRSMNALRRQAPWIGAALLCAVAVAIRQFLIQPPEIAHRCDSATLSLVTTGPWWCSVRSAVIMTYAWGGLFYASLLLSAASLVARRGWLAATTLAVGLVAIVWYSYEPGAVAITIGALVLARSRERDAPAGVAGRSAA